MDIHPDVATGITAVSPPDPLRWFTTLREAYEEASADGVPSADSFSTAFARRAGESGIDPDLVDEFAERLAAAVPDPMETVRGLYELGDHLPAWYDTLIAADEAETGGSDEEWEAFTTWFCYEAEQRGVAEQAGQFVAYVDTQSDKVAVFVEYGVPIARPEQQQAEAVESDPAEAAIVYADVSEGDSGEWVEYLD